MSKDLKSMKTTSFLGENTELIGNLSVKGGLRIDGKLKGSIESESAVIIGDHAHINANINARVVIASGRVEGDIHAQGHVQINLPGSMKGSIETQELIVEKGVYFDGSCQIIEPDSEEL